MKYEFCNQAILDITQSLIELSQEKMYLNLPINILYGIYKNSKLLYDEAQVIDGVKMFLMSKYNLDVSNFKISPGDEYYNLLHAEITELLALKTKVEIDIFDIEQLPNNCLDKNIIFPNLFFMFYTSREEKQVTLSNEQIFIYASNLIDVFNDNDQYLPVKINFYLQKNRAALINAANQIEQLQLDIVNKYGILDVNNPNQYTILPENVEQAQKELSELLNTMQDIKIYMLDLDELESLNITSKQMQSILFMIKEVE